MFHRLNRFSCPPLEKLNEIARLTVMFGLEREDNRDPAQIKVDFEAYFTGNGLPKVGDWLWGKHKIIREPLLALLAIPVAQKQLLSSAITADIKFEVYSCTGNMSTLSLNQNDPAIQIVKSMMIEFYESILCEQKVPADLVGEISDFDRQAFLKRFLMAQQIKVCPGCDGLPPSVDLYANKVREDVDHFLPKSKYPVLAVHPLNLVPLCKTCNRDYKKERDALFDTSSDVADVTDLEHIFHPYLRPACDEVSVSVSRCTGKSTPRISIKPLDGSTIGWSRVHSLEYTLALESRWNGELAAGRLEETIKQGLVYATASMRMQGTVGSPVLEQQYALITQSVAKSIGRIPGSIPSHAFALWLAQDESARDERARIAGIALNPIRQKSLPAQMRSLL